MLGALVVGGQFLASCSEKIDDSNLYTFTGETVADYLKNHAEFSKFDSIVNQAGLNDLLSAYGTYTCFAPTNEAVDEYLDSLYNDTAAVTKHNGMSAPGMAGLFDPNNKEKGDSLCKDIAEYHLTSSEVNGVDMGNGVTITTVLGRDLSTTTDSVSGKVCINNYSLITQMDIEKENGIVHVINHVLRRSNNLVGGELDNMGGFGIWVKALQLTGLGDSLNVTKRENIGSQVEQKDDKAYSWKVEDGCKEGFTIFAESDKVFRNRRIFNINDLIDYANKHYANAAEWYPYLSKVGATVSTGTDYTNPWNALNMFIRYHILPYSVSRDRLTYSYNEITSAKLYEYNRTLLPYTLMKVSFEKDDHGYIINRGITNASLTSKAGSLTVDESIQGTTPAVYGVKIKTDESVNPLNGWIHPLEDVLVYDEDVPNKVLNERLRFDDTSLFDEMMSNGFRGATKADLVTFTKTTGKSRIIFPTDFFGNIKVYNGTLTVMKYLVKDESSAGYDNYQGDEFLCEGPYDFAIKLPSVPLDGQYEIRIGYTAELARGMLQFYLGTSSDRNTMQPLDIPLDMRIAPAKGTIFNTTTGWQDYRNELDNGVATDQAMRNLGYMRGIHYYNRKDGSDSGRERGNCLRRIVYRGNLTQGEHWLRFKTVLPEMTNAQFHLDYIELVPQNVYNNASYSEDIF